MPSYNIPVSVKFEFELQCDHCGSDLDYDEKNTTHGGTVYMIQPCMRCIEVSEEVSYDKGHEEGYKDGHGAGYSEGYADGHVSGYEDGQQSMEPKDPL